MSTSEEIIECDTASQQECEKCVEMLRCLFLIGSEEIIHCCHDSSLKCGLRHFEFYIMERTGRDWIELISDLKKTREQVSQSWLLQNFNTQMDACQTEPEIHQFIEDTEKEARRARKFRQLGVEAMRIGKMRSKTMRVRRVDLHQILCDAKDNKSFIISPNIGPILSDPFRWGSIVKEIINGGEKIFGELLFVRLKHDNLCFFFANPNNPDTSELKEITSPLGIEFYKANRMLSWDRCHLNFNYLGDLMVVEIAFSENVLKRQRYSITPPEKCADCFEIFGKLERVYRALHENIFSPEECPAEKILLPAVRGRRFLNRQWEFIFSSLERIGWDTCEPLSCVIRLCRALLSNDTILDKTETLNSIKEQVKIFQMLWLSTQSEGGNVILENPSTGIWNVSNFNFSEVVDETVARLSRLITLRDVDIVQKGEMPDIFGRKDRWAMALREMLINSICYNDNKPVIEIIALKERILVKDNGIGIPLEKWGVVFDPFTSLRSGKYSELDIEQESANCGMGMFFARLGIQWDGGDLRIASSKEGEGTTFEIILPR